MLASQSSCLPLIHADMFPPTSLDTRRRIDIISCCVRSGATCTGTTAFDPIVERASVVTLRVSGKGVKAARQQLWAFEGETADMVGI
jgi:hypothetical protein